MPDGHDYQDQDAPREPVFPTTVTMAGVGWIAFGALILLQLLALLALTFLVAQAGPDAARRGAVGGALCGAVLGGFFGAVFIHVGVGSIKGTAKDTLGNGVGSIIFGLMNFGAGVVQLAGPDGADDSGAARFIFIGLYFLAGVGLIAAGALALAGRAQYKAWRKARKAAAGPKR